MMRLLLAAALLLAVATTGFARTPVVTPLTAAEIPALVKAPAHGERIIMFWSLDCVYCEPNMQALAKLQRAHPDRVELVTVATDDATQASAIEARLRAASMQDYPARAYAAADPARFNFLIDPDWGGETPRTLVLRADGSRLGISGELTAGQLRRIAPR